MGCVLVIQRVFALLALEDDLDAPLFFYKGI